MSAIVDLQGFSGPKGQFVLKEVSILAHGMSLPAVYQFAPPYPWHDLSSDLQRRNAWVERNYLRLKWNSGTIPYNRIHEILHSHLGLIEMIYVKGREKVEWLRTLLQSTHHMIENLENDYDDDDDVIPSLRKLTNTCPHHKKQYMCAADNVMALSQFIILKPAVEPSADRSIRRFYEMGSLHTLSTADLACLPKSFLLCYCAQYIEEARPRLPEKFKMDPEIAHCRRCSKHNTGVTECDGPAPLVKKLSKIFITIIVKVFVL